MMFQGRHMAKRATILVAAAALGLAGCAAETADDQAEATSTEMPADHPATDGVAPEGMGEMSAPHGQVSVLIYECADEKSFALTVAPGVGQAALRFEEGVFQLEQQEVASGMEFTDGTYTFRGKGTDGYVERDGERIFTECTASGHPMTPDAAETPES
jgi:membrane-bound inhibitor of C-type lysozyme